MRLVVNATLIAFALSQTALADEQDGIPGEERTTITTSAARRAEAVRRIEELEAARTGPAALPAGHQAGPLRIQEAAWSDEHLLAAYQKHRRKDLRWDAHVASFLDEAARSFPREPNWTRQLLQWQRAQEAVETLGCDDPLVQYLSARLALARGYRLQILSLRREARRQMQAALKDFPQSGYSQALQRFARLDGVAIDINEIEYSSTGTNPADNPRELGPAFWKAFRQEFQQALSEPWYQGAGLPLLFEHIDVLWTYNRVDWPEWMRFISEVIRDPRVDAWLAHMLAARFHYALAWDARGTATINRVPAENYAKFERHLRLASDHLLEAWLLHPEWPQAASRLIGVAGTGAGVVPGSPRFWFDQAVSAEFDYLPAYGSLINFLQPKWGGSNEELIGFGRECLATGRFDTDVPFTMRDVVNTILAPGGGARVVYQREGVYPDLARMYEDYIVSTGDEYLQQILRTEWLAVALFAGAAEDGRRLLAELGDDVNFNVLATTYGLHRRHLERWLERASPEDTRPFVGHLGQTGAVAWTPDGRRLISGGVEDMTIKFWDAETGAEVAIIGDFGERIWALAVSHDGRYLAAGGRGGQVVVYDLTSRQRVHTFPAPPLVMSLAFSPDGRRLAWGGGVDSGPGHVSLWDLESGQAVELDQPRTQVADLAFSPDGSTLAVSCTFTGDARRRQYTPGELRLYDVATARVVKTATPFALCAYALVFSPDGRTLVASGQQLNRTRNRTSELQLLDAHSLEARKAIPIPNGPVRTLVFSPDGQRFATGSDDQTVTLRSADGELQKRLLWHGERVNDIAFSADGTQLATSDLAGFLRVWDVAEVLQRPDVTLLEASLRDYKHSGTTYSLAVSPDGQLLAVGGSSQVVTLWNATTGKPQAFLEGDGWMTTDMAFSPDATELIALQNDGRRRFLTLWNVGDGSSRRFDVPANESVVGLAWLPDTRHVFITGLRNHRILDTGNGQIVATLNKSLETHSCGAVSPDGRLLVVGDRRGSVAHCRLPEPKSWANPASAAEVPEPVVINARGQYIREIAVSPDGMTIGAGAREMGVRLWDIERQEIRATLDGSAVDFSPDGTKIVTAGGETLLGTARVWDVSTGRLLVEFEGGHAMTISAARFLPDGRRVATVCLQGYLRVWDAETGRPVH